MTKSKKTASGDVVGRAPARVALAQEKLFKLGYGKVRAELMDTFGVSHATAERDIAEAQRLIADEAERERPTLRARELERLVRVAGLAEAAGNYSAAVRASQQIAKLCGLEAPTEIVATVKPAPAQIDVDALSPEQQRTMLGLLEHAAPKQIEVADGEAEADARQAS